MRERGAGGRDAAICEHEVGAAQQRGDVQDEQPVEEADRCVPEELACDEGDRRVSYRSAGSRPKKATNVKNDTVRARIMSARASAMAVATTSALFWWSCWRGSTRDRGNATPQSRRLVSTRPQRVDMTDSTIPSAHTMPAAVVYDDVAEGADVATGALFEGCRFWVAQRVPIRASYLAKIEANGGQLVKLEKQADFLIADHFRKDCAPGTISYEFIDKSIAKGELLDPDDFPAGPRTGTARDVGSIVQPAKGTRAAYTPEEDRQLYKWVRDAQALGIAVSGNELYKQLEEKNPRHTWQSWRDRYLKKLQYLPPSAFTIPDNAPPSPPSDRSSRAAEVPVVKKTGLVKNKDIARLDAAGESVSMDTAASTEQAASKDRAASAEVATEPLAAKRTGLVKNKDKARVAALDGEPATVEAAPSKAQAVSATHATTEDTSGKKDYNISQLAATFSTEDWEDLYAFVEEIDSAAHDQSSYETSWTTWAENKDNQTAEQWRQYYEKVVRPQWFRDSASKRESIRRKVEERRVGDESSPTKSQSWSQTQDNAGSASQRGIAASQEIGEAPSKLGSTVSNTLPSDARLESEATAQQETPQYIREGYESALKRIRGDQDAAPASANAARPTKMRRMSGPEESAADEVSGTQEQPLDISSAAGSQQGESERLATEEATRSRTQQRVSQIVDLGDEELSEAGSDAPQKYPGIPLLPPGYMEWVELRDAAIAAGSPIPPANISAATYRQWQRQRSLASSAAMPPWERPLQGIDYGDGFAPSPDEAASEASEDDVEPFAPLPRPSVLHQSEQETGDANDLESIASSTDLTHIAPLPRPPQIPEASDDDDDDDGDDESSLPSNTPTPRATKLAAFDTQAILSPSQTAPFLSRLPRPIDSSPPHHPDSEASTTQSLQEFSSYLQDNSETATQTRLPLTKTPRPASPTPSATSESAASDVSAGSSDPDPPLAAREMDAFFAAQTALGSSTEHITKALKRTRFRPGLAASVLDAWRRGSSLPDQRGVWSVQEDSLCESGDGASLARLGRKHTVDGWGGVTERMNFLRAWGTR